MTRSIHQLLLWITLALAVIFATTPSQAAASTIKVLTISKGKSKELVIHPLERHRLDKETIIQVSRKNNMLLLTGKSEGSTKVDIVSFGGKIIRSYSVRVSNPSRASSKQDDPPEFCTNSGIECSTDLNHLTGITDAWQARNQAIYFCRRRAYCSFDIGLTQAALDAQKAHYQKTFVNLLEYETTNTDLAILRFDCNATSLSSWQKLVNTLSNRAQSRGAALVQCANAEQSSIMYKLVATIKLSAKNSDEKSDALSDFHPIYRTKGNDGANLGKSKHSHQSVLARPEVFIIANEPTTLTSGSEMPVYELESEKGIRSLTWKPVGLSASFQISPRADGALLLKYRISLTQSDRSSSLRANQLEGHFVASLNDTSELGRIYLDMEKSQNSETYWLRKIPLVGPLFRVVESNTNNVSIVFEVSISEHNPNAPKSKH